MGPLGTAKYHHNTAQSIHFYIQAEMGHTSSPIEVPLVFQRHGESNCALTIHVKLWHSIVKKQLNEALTIGKERLDPCG